MRQKSRAGPPSSLQWTFVSSIPPLKVGENLGKSGNIRVAWGSGEDERRERGSKLYSKHDVRNDRNIMAMGPQLDMEKRGWRTAMEGVGRVGSGRAHAHAHARARSQVQVAGEHLVLDRRHSDLAFALSEKTSLPQFVI